jgi:hypothetical protein
LQNGNDKDAYKITIELRLGIQRMPILTMSDKNPYKALAGYFLCVVFLAATVTCSAIEVTITRAGTNIVLSWPRDTINEFYLQKAANLAYPLIWTNEADPVTNGTDLTVTKSLTGPGCFYRLQAWENLFDGTNVSAFREFPTNASNSFPSNSWLVTNGILATRVVANPTHLITRVAYSDCELRWRWKTDTNGNSGVFYRETSQSNSLSAVSQEYQLLDDQNRTEVTDPRHQLAAVWGLISATNRQLVPTTNWNDCRVIVSGNRVQHWLNGRVVIDYYINSPQWTNIVSPSAIGYFGQATNAYLGFQNIGNNDAGVVPGMTYFQDIKVRRLP